MFQGFKDFLSDITSGTKHPSRFDDSDYRVAAAALLVHAAEIDGSMSAAERTKLHVLIKQRFELGDAETDELLKEATEAEHEASTSTISPAS